MAKEFRSNPNLYFFNQGPLLVLLMLYVDDRLITGNDLTLINSAKAMLSSKCKMKDLGALCLSLLCLRMGSTWSLLDFSLPLQRGLHLPILTVFTSRGGVGVISFHLA